MASVQIHLWNVESVQPLRAASELCSLMASQAPVCSCQPKRGFIPHSMRAKIFLTLPNPPVLSLLIRISWEHESWKIYCMSWTFFSTVQFSLLAHVKFFSLLWRLVFKIILNHWRMSKEIFKGLKFGLPSGEKVGSVSKFSKSLECENLSKSLRTQIAISATGFQWAISGTAFLIFSKLGTVRGVKIQ